jgi:hypothetical protein
MATIAATITSDAQAVSAAVTLRLNALENLFSTAIPDGEKLLADATNDLINGIAVGSSIAPEAVAAATAAVTAAGTGNVAAAAVDIGGVLTPISAGTQAVINFFKGVGEGWSGQAAPAGASGAEKAGDTLGQDAGNLLEAIEDSIEGKVKPDPTNSGGAVGGS